MPSGPAVIHGLTSTHGWQYSEVMLGGRIVSIFLAATIFLLQGGDCVSLFFANKQAQDCCQKGHCNRKNPDPCCQVSSKADVKQVQAKEKVPLLVLTALPVLPAWTHPVFLEPIDSRSHLVVTYAPSPPGQLGNFSLPLLV